MEANELRIGNLVADYDCSPYYFAVEQITKTTDGDVRVHYRNNSISVIASDAPPIPLTEEWLLKFGFVRDNDGIYFLDAWQPIHGQRFVIEWVGGKILCRSHYQPYASDYAMHFIKHIHQVQNLYHALTGEELTIKST